MSQAVSASINFSLPITETLTVGLNSGPITETPSFSLKLSNGTGANAINRKWSKDSTAAAAADTWTLSGLTDDLGRSVVFAKIRALLIINLDATHDLTVGNATTHPWSAPFDTATDTIKVRAGGMLLLVAPDASGFAVAASTSDQLKIDPGANTVEYKIVVLGE